MAIMAGIGGNLVCNITPLVQTEIRLLVHVIYVIQSIFHFAGSNGKDCPEFYEICKLLMKLH